MDWKKSPFTERDAIDLARTVGDRLTSFSRYGEPRKPCRSAKSI